MVVLRTDGRLARSAARAKLEEKASSHGEKGGARTLHLGIENEEHCFLNGARESSPANMGNPASAHGRR